MTTTLSPAPFQKFFDNNGNPLSNGLLFVYSAGTTTKATTWTDSTGGTPNSNPIVLDYRGECNLWISPNVGYKYVLAPATDTDPPTNPIKTVDNIVNSQLITLYGGVDTGVANAYVLNFTSNFSAYADGIMIEWLPSNTNTSASTININGIGIVSIVNQDGSALVANQIIANQIIGIIYRGGKFYLLSPAYLQGSFTATLTGMTAVTTGTMNYKIVGGFVTLYLQNAIVGTSNSGAMTISSFPTFLLPTNGLNGRTVFCTGLQDNSAPLLFATAMLSTATDTLVFTPIVVSGATFANGTFTAAGTKGLLATWTITYPL